MSIPGMTDLGRVKVIQSVRDAKYKDYVLKTLENSKTTLLDEVMARKFPEDKWVCEIETNGRKPWISKTEKWPSQYLCVCKDRIFYVLYRVYDENIYAVFRDRLESLEKQLIAEQKLTTKLEQQLIFDR